MLCIFGNSSLLFPQHLFHVIICVFVVVSILSYGIEVFSLYFLIYFLHVVLGRMLNMSVFFLPEVLL